jgi:hypothetical protein
MPHLNPEKTLSGHGSTTSSTRMLLRELEIFLQVTNIKTFFDAPCGDFNWIKNLRLPDDCDYIGGDIVPELISNLQQIYGGKCGPNKSGSRQFIHLDLTRNDFPSADIWLCKDCLQHLSNADVTHERSSRCPRLVNM